MERLLVKYADKIIEFEEKLRDKYKTNSIELKVNSSVSWLGEELRVESEQGDYFTLYEDEDGVLNTNYFYKMIEKAKTFDIEIDETTTINEKWCLKVIERADGSFTYKNWRDYLSTLSFTDVDSLIKHVIEHDEMSKEFTYNGEESKYNYKILEDEQ
ncbi:hypothetical protein P3U36_07840 [Staphylococcus pseudintermedius]|uniref:hypothetical protein n=1 Tax=Staphylococcus pseudintermedius TaxID=283734 RepID=UPI002AC956CD|nr:hypothetical protein [Staphylococcus pseudintermedius]WQL64589.1 hypothetical protein P3U36_07840 [Staphylococcus pseudintermedius]